MALSRQGRLAKLQRLAQLENFESVEALLQDCMRGETCWAICCNPANMACDFTAELEKDCRDGFCENCQDGTMVSALVLAGLV